MNMYILDKLSAVTYKYVDKCIKGSLTNIYLRLNRELRKLVYYSDICQILIIMITMIIIILIM